MDAQDFARQFGQLYRQRHKRTVHPIDDVRDTPSAATLSSERRSTLPGGLQSLIAALPHNPNPLP